MYDCIGITLFGFVIHTQRLVVININALKVFQLDHGIHNIALILTKEFSGMINITGQHNVGIIINDITLEFITIASLNATLALCWKS